MNETSDGPSTVEQLPSQKSALVSGELAKLLDMARGSAPKDAKISIEFDGQLRLHIDVRNGEDIEVLKKILPSLGTGIFHGIEVGATPHHPFFHRISALIDR
ncbi:hypothetical protein [Novosphingobium beihaiensis]|uniref:Uncharacterized protein n=1 Tax=Novosphingobium beihaiensis TaxID=2930389 RepID=A0ABT0BWC8_9SPHN|nr:hypothetical protein [Novosphingobium beihaiensis]MCJ2188954.1 hypothetical protein [Novosphingobium beihaiensis]